MLLRLLVVSYGRSEAHPKSKAPHQHGTPMRVMPHRVLQVQHAVVLSLTSVALLASNMDEPSLLFSDVFRSRQKTRLAVHACLLGGCFILPLHPDIQFHSFSLPYLSCPSFVTLLIWHPTLFSLPAGPANVNHAAHQMVIAASQTFSRSKKLRC